MRKRRFCLLNNGVSRFSGFGVVDIRSRNFSTRSSRVNDSESIDQTLMQSMEQKIKEQLNAESVTVMDMSGDGRHVCINVVSSAFEGQPAVNRHVGGASERSSCGWLNDNKDSFRV